MKNLSNQQSTSSSASQILMILLICRYQTFMVSIYCRSIFEVRDSNIFISMFISLISSLIIFIPALILLKKFDYSNIIDISQKIFPKAGKIIPLLFSIYFLLMAIAHITNTGFFMISYVYVDASPFLVSGIIIAAIYALFLGIKTILTSGSMIFIIFVFLNILMFLLLIPTYNVNNFGPFVLSDISSIINNSSMLTFGAELVAMLVLCEYSNSKTPLIYTLFQIILFFTEAILMIAITLSVGRYANDNMFPIYIMSSTIEVSMFERLEAFYIVTDTLLSVIKTATYLFLCARCLGPTINQKYYKISITIISAICLITSVIIIYDIETLRSLLEFINSPLVILFFIVFLPVFLLISSKIKNLKTSQVLDS